MLEEDRRPAVARGSAASASQAHHENMRQVISNSDTAVEGTSEDITAVEAAMLRRQMIKLNRRLQLLEEENKERSKREMILYSITVAFWLFSSWLWLRR